jgi:hypothetical protein
MLLVRHNFDSSPESYMIKYEYLSTVEHDSLVWSMLTRVKYSVSECASLSGDHWILLMRYLLSEKQYKYLPHFTHPFFSTMEHLSNVGNYSNSKRTWLLSMINADQSKIQCFGMCIIVWRPLDSLDEILAIGKAIQVFYLISRIHSFQLATIGFSWWGTCYRKSNTSILPHFTHPFFSTKEHVSNVGNQ